MILQAMVFAEVYSQWPAKNGKPAGEAHDILVLDMTRPGKHALQRMYQYRLTPEQVARHWGKLESKVIELAVTECNNGDRGPYLRGEIISVPEASQEKFFAPGA